MKTSNAKIKQKKLKKIHANLIKMGIKIPSSPEENHLLARQAHIRVYE